MPDPAPRSAPRTYLIHDGSLDPESLTPLPARLRPELLPWAQRSVPPGNARVLLWLPDEPVRELLATARDRAWAVAVLPHPEATTAQRALGAKGRVADLIEHYAAADPVDTNLLTCNGQVVLATATVGETLAVRPHEADQAPSRWQVFRLALQRLHRLHLDLYQITTAKEQKVQLAALGMVVAEHRQRTLFGRGLLDGFRHDDGRLGLLILAPRCILGYLWFLLRLLLPRRVDQAHLPPSVGLIRSRRILIESARGIDYTVDGRRIAAKRIELGLDEPPIRLLPAPDRRSTAPAHQDKDSLRLGTIPRNATARNLIGRRVPVFPRAAEEDFRDLFITLRENARVSSPFLVLTVLSVLLALSGLYANSAPVIIGAMILAPLMAPIVSLSMGLARADSALIRDSIQTLALGIGTGLSCAMLAAWVMPLTYLTAEMQARMSPTLLDLSVAVVSGIAGAYAHAREDLARNLAGVAIAVALVPPLSVAGIGLGWGNWSMAGGALLLFTANLVGICLAAGATFLVLGFAPFRVARRGLAFMLAVSSLVVGPLYFAFMDLVDQAHIAQGVPTGRLQLEDRQVEVRLLNVRTGEPPLVRVVVASPTPLEPRQLDALKGLIAQRIGRDLILDTQVQLRR